MDYKEKVIALLNSQELSEEQKEKLENIFPELAESEDERTRKELIEFLKLPHSRFVGKRDHEKWIAWLEKQDEKSTIIDIDKMVMKYSQTKDGGFGLPLNCMIRAYREGINDALKLLLNLEKQGEQKHFSDFKASDWYVSKVDGKIHNIYQSVDKAEPKFKVGDWIVTYKGDTVQIGAVNDGYYTIGNGMDFNSSYVDGCWHKWTIQDAKDGDVLVDSYSKDSTIILYKGIYKERTVLAHCGWNGYNLSVNKNGFGYGGLDNTNYLPATKEQRDLLFQKMKQAGFEWDAEKKELHGQILKITPKFCVGQLITDNNGTWYNIRNIKCLDDWYYEVYDIVENSTHLELCSIIDEKFRENRFVDEIKKMMGD